MGLEARLSDFSARLDLRGDIVGADGTDFLGITWPVENLPVSSLVHPDDVARFERAMEAALFLDRKQSFPCRMLKRGTVPVWMDCHLARIPATPEFAFIAFDVAHWHGEEERVSRLATHDPLTGLPNRLLLNDRIAVGISAVQRQQQPGFSLQLLDIDGFKKINDSLGNSGGDELIRAIASRLKSMVRESDTVARIGGDEFALILSGVCREKEAEIVAKKMLTAMHRPFYLDGKCLYVSLSIGAALHPEHGQDPVSLFRHAEMAMYRAKELGGNCWRLFDRHASPESVDISIESEMHEGIRNGEFLLHYQPIFDAVSGRLAGAEALMRWESPEKGPTPPSIFIPLAESSGLIDLLGKWVLRMACHQAKQWQEDLPGFYVSVNVSPRQFRQEGLLESVKGALEESGLSPASLMIEITEGMLMQDPERSRAILETINNVGVTLAIDDFGTGYSSLAYLQRLPLDTLKIDQTFVAKLTLSPDDETILGTIVLMAHALGLNVVAEGVESQDQVEYLREKDCDEIQGYHFAQPMPGPDCFRFIHQHRARRSTARA